MLELRFSTRSLLVALAALLLAACSLVIDKKLEDKKAAADSGTMRADSGTMCVPGLDCDGNTCTVEDSCSPTGACLPGSRARDGVVCERDTTPGGDVCIDGLCTQGRCGDGVLDPRTEECDMGAEPPPTCRSCRIRCVVDAHCGNSDPCDGVERCMTVTGMCMAGELPVDNTVECPLEDAGMGTCRSGSCMLPPT